MRLSGLQRFNKGSMTCPNLSRDASASAPVSKVQASEAALVIAKFIDACVADQIRLAPDKLISVCKRFKDHIMFLDTPIRGVAPMLVALRKLQSSPEQLTALPPEFLLMCLLAKCYKTGLCVLEDNVYEIDHLWGHDLYWAKAVPQSIRATA